MKCIYVHIFHNFSFLGKVFASEVLHIPLLYAYLLLLRCIYFKTLLLFLLHRHIFQFFFTSVYTSDQSLKLGVRQQHGEAEIVLFLPLSLYCNINVMLHYLPLASRGRAKAKQAHRLLCRVLRMLGVVV